MNRCLALLLAAVVAVPAAAQEWPTKTVHLVVPYPPGGNVDSAARIVADQLQQKLGQPVIVENKAGAGGMLAGDMVARSDARRLHAVRRRQRAAAVLAHDLRPRRCTTGARTSRRSA